ncbi:SCO family protein [Oceanobacillus sp. CAU 1775]
MKKILFTFIFFAIIFLASCGGKEIETNMASLQPKINEADLNVKLVTFSVDLDYDTPEVLKSYAVDYSTDLSNWFFLTRYDFNTIRDPSRNSFRSAVEDAPPGSDQVTHGTSFFLVNPEGEVIKRYSAVKSEEMDVIVEDLKIVSEH